MSPGSMHSPTPRVITPIRRSPIDSGLALARQAIDAIPSPTSPLTIRSTTPPVTISLVRPVTNQKAESEFVVLQTGPPPPPRRFVSGFRASSGEEQIGRHDGDRTVQSRACSSDSYV